MNTKLQDKRKHKGGTRKREKKGRNAEEDRKGIRKKQESSIVIGNQCKKDTDIYSCSSEIKQSVKETV